MAAEELDAQIQITLHYIDKLFAARQRLTEAAHRFFLIGIAVSVVVLAISGGIASTDQAMKVAGIGLKVPVAVLITFGAVAAGVLTLAFFSSLQHAGLIDKEIQRLYRDIEFKDRTLYAEIASPFRNENALTAFIGQFSLEQYQDPAGIEASTSHPSYPVKMRLLIALLLVIPTATPSRGRL